ncbi:hypothetical protein ABK040_011165 [Willaertia magna]
MEEQHLTEEQSQQLEQLKKFVDEGLMDEDDYFKEKLKILSGREIGDETPRNFHRDDVVITSEEVDDKPTIPKLEIITKEDDKNKSTNESSFSMEEIEEMVMNIQELRQQVSDLNEKTKNLADSLSVTKKEKLIKDQEKEELKDYYETELKNIREKEELKVTMLQKESKESVQSLQKSLKEKETTIEKLQKENERLVKEVKMLQESQQHNAYNGLKSDDESNENKPLLSNNNNATPAPSFSCAIL